MSKPQPKISAVIAVREPEPERQARFAAAASAFTQGLVLVDPPTRRRHRRGGERCYVFTWETRLRVKPR